MKRHQKPVVFKYRLLLVIYLSHLFLYYIYIYIYIMHKLRHWTSVACMLPQSHCGDDEDGRIGLSSWRHYICIYIYIYIYIHIFVYIYIHYIYMYMYIYKYIYMYVYIHMIITWHWSSISLNYVLILKDEFCVLHDVSAYAFFWCYTHLVLLLPFFLLLVSISYYLYNFVSLLIRFF